MSITNCEVKSLENQSYFPGFIKGINGDLLLIGYPDNWKPDELVPAHLVRPAPLLTDFSTFRPEAGDLIEAMACASPSTPTSWWKVRVLSVRSNLYVVDFVDCNPSHQVVYELEQLRPYNKLPHIDLSKLDHQVYPLPPEMKFFDNKWLSDLQHNAGLFILIVNPDYTALTAVGTPESIKKFNLLINYAIGRYLNLIHTKNKRQEYDNIYNLLELEKLNYTTIQFNVDPKFIGLMIGKGGANISKIKEIDGVVNVNIDPDGTVKVTVKNPEIFPTVRRELEVIEHEFKVDKSLLPSVVGKFSANLDTIKTQTNVFRISYDKNFANDNNSVTSIYIIGKAENVENAIMLLEQQVSIATESYNLTAEARELQQKLLQFEKSIYGRSTKYLDSVLGFKPSLPLLDEITKAKFKKKYNKDDNKKLLVGLGPEIASRIINNKKNNKKTNNDNQSKDEKNNNKSKENKNNNNQSNDDKDAVTKPTIVTAQKVDNNTQDKKKQNNNVKSSKNTEKQVISPQVVKQEDKNEKINKPVIVSPSKIVKPIVENNNNDNNNNTNDKKNNKKKKNKENDSKTTDSSDNKKNIVSPTVLNDNKPVKNNDNNTQAQIVKPIVVAKNENTPVKPQIVSPTKIVKDENENDKSKETKNNTDDKKKSKKTFKKKNETPTNKNETEKSESNSLNIVKAQVISIAN